VPLVCRDAVEVSLWHAKSVRSSGAAPHLAGARVQRPGCGIEKRKYLNQTVHGGLRDAQSHLNKMLGERDRGRNFDSSKQTLNQYLDRWLEVCAKPRLRAKSFQDYEGLLRRYVRPRLGGKTLATVTAFDIQILYRELLTGGLSARSIRYTHAVLRSALKQAFRWNLILANPADLVDLPRQNRRRVGVLRLNKHERS
jgi:integrase